MNLFIAKMENATKVIPPRTLLRTPTLAWEKHGFPVNEGPYIIQTDDKERTFLVFSGSSTFTPDYCLSMIGIDGGKDPMVASNWWNDVNRCLFHRNDYEGVWTTGHASFVKSPGCPYYNIEEKVSRFRVKNIKILIAKAFWFR